MRFTFKIVFAHVYTDICLHLIVEPRLTSSNIGIISTGVILTFIAFAVAIVPFIVWCLLNCSKGKLSQMHDSTYKLHPT